MEKESKQIVEVKEQVVRMNTAIQALPAVIVDQAGYDETQEVGKRVATLLKNIDKEEKAITKPINDSLKKIRDLFRPFKTQVTDVSNDLKSRRQVFINAEEVKRAKKEAQIAARVEKGTMREDTAVGQLSNLETSAPEVNGGMMSVLVVKVIDIKLIPEQYLTVNATQLRADYREGIEVPGVEFIYEKRARN